MIRKILILTFLSLLFYSPVQATNWCEDANVEGCWLFTEGTGTTVDDSSSNSNVGNFKGTGEPAWDATDVPFAVSGSAPNSVHFDASNDYINFGSDTSIDDLVNFTFLTWANIDATKENARIIDKTTKIIYLTVTNTTTCQITTSGTTRINITSATLTATQWAHIAVSYSNGVAPIIYINGSASSNGNNNGTGSDSADNTINLGYGNRISDAARAFDGLMTDAALFSAALDSTDINDIMDNGLVQGSTPPATRNRLILIN